MGAFLIHCADFENLVFLLFFFSYFGWAGVCICSANGAQIHPQEVLGCDSLRKHSGYLVSLFNSFSSPLKNNQVLMHTVVYTIFSMLSTRTIVFFLCEGGAMVFIALTVVG